MERLLFAFAKREVRLLSDRRKSITRRNLMVTNEDRYAVLERKLMEAESALFGCRAVLNQIRSMEQVAPAEVQTRGSSGLYEGQLNPPGLQESDVEEECVE